MHAPSYKEWTFWKNLSLRHSKCYQALAAEPHMSPHTAGPTSIRPQYQQPSTCKTSRKDPKLIRSTAWLWQYTCTHMPGHPHKLVAMQYRGTPQSMGPLPQVWKRRRMLLGVSQLGFTKASLFSRSGVIAHPRRTASRTRLIVWVVPIFLLVHILDEHRIPRQEWVRVRVQGLGKRMYRACMGCSAASQERKHLPRSVHAH